MGNTSSDHRQSDMSTYSSSSDIDGDEEDEEEEEEEEEHSTHGIISSSEGRRQRHRGYSYLSEEEGEEVVDEDTCQMPRRSNVVRYDDGDVVDPEMDSTAISEKTHARRKQRRLNDRMRARDHAEGEQRAKREDNCVFGEVLTSRSECRKLIVELQFDHMNRIIHSMRRPNDDYDITDMETHRIGIFSCSSAEIPGTRDLLDIQTRCKREIDQYQAKRLKLQRKIKASVESIMTDRKCSRENAMRAVMKSHDMQMARSDCIRYGKSLEQFRSQYDASVRRYDDLIATAKNLHILEDEKAAIELATSVMPSHNDISAIAHSLKQEHNALDEAIDGMDDVREELSFRDGTDSMMDMDDDLLRETNDFLFGFDDDPPIMGGRAISEHAEEKVGEEDDEDPASLQVAYSAPAAPTDVPRSRTPAHAARSPKTAVAVAVATTS